MLEGYIDLRNIPMNGDMQGSTQYGIKGDPGPAGPKGDDYVLTDADKAEIAEMAADLVEVPEHSGGNAEDGFSPVANVEQTATGAVISITDKSGTTTATITNGKDGDDGTDGISPTVAVSKSGRVTTLTITDKNGTKTATIYDGTTGHDGETGERGFGFLYYNGSNLDSDEDFINLNHLAAPAGYDPQIGDLMLCADGYVFEIVGLSPDTGAEVRSTGICLIGKDGADGTKGDKGDKGDTGATGAQGEPGEDGQRGTGILKVTTAPTSYTTATAGKNPIKRMALSTIKTQAGVNEVLVGDQIAHSYYHYHIYYVDATYAYMDVSQSIRGAGGAQGEKGDTGATGAAGKDGVDGKDYMLTPADKSEIMAMVIESLGGNPIFGVVDANNHIVLNGDLPDGTYSVKYEMEDGSKVNIGDLVLDTNVYCTVTNNLTNCTSSNSAKQVVEGESYSATITANSGYELKSVTVTMDGSPVTVSGGTISIANVTGNIVITAVAEEIKANYTNLFVPKKATLNTRLNSSAAVTQTDGYVLTDFMDVSGKTPFTADTKIYMKGVNVNGDGSSRIFVYKTEGTTYTGCHGITNANTWAITDEGNGVISVKGLDSYFTSGVVRACMCLKVKSSAITASDIENIVITIDEPIV